MVKNKMISMKKKCLRWSEKNDLEIILKAIKASKIVVGTSDTVPGLLAPLTKEGAEQLDIIKGRKDKPYIILVASSIHIEKFVDVGSGLAIQIERLVQQCWPGPLTLIFKARPDLPLWQIAANGTVSLRVPKHDGLLQLLQHFDGLFSTSANKTGETTPQSLGDIDESIMQNVVYCVGDLIKSGAVLKPSTILDCTGEQIKMVRQGAFSKIELEAIAGCVIK